MSDRDDPSAGPVYLFKGQQYVGSDEPASTKLISSFWGQVRNHFVPAESDPESGETNVAVDTAFIAPDGKTYLFKGNQFIRYTHFDNEFADEGYPLPIKDNWGNLPARFEDGIDGGFVFDGKTYLLNDGGQPEGNQPGHAEYVRYSRPDYHLVDNIYPQKVADRWRHWGDFLLADIRLISVYKQLQDETSGRDYSLTDFLNSHVGDQATPYQILHSIFGWERDEVMWLKRHNAFLPTANDPNRYTERLENRFELETIEKMTQIFNTTRKLGVEPSVAFAEIWQPLFAPSAEIKRAADHLYRYLGAKHSQQDWAILKTQIHDELNLMERDIWVPLAIAQDPTLTRPKDLFELLLIDVEMGHAARTSKVKEAISAVQLYLHRYLVNLESLEPVPRESGYNREAFKERWQWLKNYRLWEANRKVFLYPENYIRPELRDTKTPEFQQLEEALLQGELNSETAEAALTSYLESFGTVGNLKIAGANVYEDKDDQVLLLFGQTRLEPQQFYYRTARFSKQSPSARNTSNVASPEDDLVVWSPWEKVDVSIASDRVFPIQANGRLMVFWIEIEDIEEPDAKFKSKPNMKPNEDAETVSEVNVAQKRLRHEAHIKYSLLKYNQHWTPPQQIKQRIKLDYEIDAAYSEGDEIVTFVGGYCLKTTKKSLDGEVKRIKEFDEFKKLPASFHSGIDAATIFDGKRYLFKGGQCIIQELGSSEFVVKSMPDLIERPKNDQLLIVAPGIFHVDHVIDKSTQEKPLIYEGVDAAFDFGHDILTLIDKKGNYSFYKKIDGESFQPIQDRETMLHELPFFPLIISTLVTREGQFRPADAVFKRDDIFYILRDGQYECYDDVGTELVPLDGFPKPIRGNLSFNMDKFFNKLHLENAIGPIHLSYISPKDEVLLYGKLKQDFTFEEIPVQEDRALTTARSWQNSSYEHLVKYGEYISAPIGTQSDTLHRELQSLKNQVDTAHAVKKANDKLTTAFKIVDKILEPKQGDDESSTDLDRNKASFDALIGEIQPALTLLTKKNTLKQEVENLLDSISTISSSVNQFHDASTSQKDQLKTEVENKLAGGRSKQREVKNAIKNISKEFKDKIGDGTAELTHLNDIHIQPDFEHYNGIRSSFESFLEPVKAYIELWKDRMNVSVEKEFELIEKAHKALTPFRQQIQSHDTQVTGNVKAALDGLKKIQANTALAATSGHLETAIKALGQVPTYVNQRTRQLKDINRVRLDIVDDVSSLARSVLEALLGTFDLFPPEFGIANTSNFAFSLPDRPDWYVFEAKDGTFLSRPLEDKEVSTYEIIRLTTTVIPRLSGILFAQEVKGFLSASTQREDEAPAFGGSNNIHFRPKRFTRQGQSKPLVPASKNLDFHGATGIYYEELFFHVPYLIAQTLNAAQKFEEAKTWYECIFDPTMDPSETGAPWKYRPFQTPAQEGDFLIDPNQLKRHLDDPFDPHAIAALRPTAYRKAIVMNYIDNLLDWGDMLFRQYTVESINEARMLYTLAHDLLGDKPENLGTLVLSPEMRLNELDHTEAYDFVIESDHVGHPLIGHERLPIVRGTPNDSVGNRYFFVPENIRFGDYWQRVDDRLYKIRQSLNIDGQAQPLPLFQPPIDPMALVQAVAGGVSLGQLIGGTTVQVPHYRFEFLAYRAQNLVQKLNQYGGELLATLEKKDGEALSLIQSQQEGDIFSLMVKIREAQIQEAEQIILNLQESQRHAQERADVYTQWLNDGKLPEEIHQINLMIAASVSHYASSLLKLGAMIASLFPDSMVGPFIMGVKTGGTNIGDSLSSAAEISESLGEGLSVTGEALAAEAQFKRMFEEWKVQRMIAESEYKQIEHQLEGARLQKLIAQYELDVLHKEIEHNQSIQTFMKEKFTNQQLYQWMLGKMSGLYFQTYQMAFDMAKMAEKAYQFERGLEERDISFIRGGYWDSRYKGLLAGEQLALDLDRMEQDFIERNEHRLEITKEVSLLELDPLAFLRLKQNGACEFSLDEAFFDYDFPGHYGRQVKTIAVEFDVPEGVTVNATLTQLNHQTVLKPDPKAVKFLIEPKDQPPTTIRSNWRGNQQVVLSHHDEFEKNSGLFELRYDTDTYLPFEGTGAVSRWKLELNGKPGSINLRDLVDITVRIQYTARQGGPVFAEAVKGLLKPYQTVRFFDMTFDFADAWNDFLDGDGDDLVLPFTRVHLIT